MATVQGLDLSSIQGSNVNFNAIKNAGYTFVILRVNTWDKVKSKSVKDPCFDIFYSRAVAAGLDIGAYWFSYANTPDYVANVEAPAALEWIKGKKFSYPIYFDLERSQQFDQGSKVCDAMITNFCTALQKAGYYPGVYCSTFWYTNCVSASVRAKYPTWIAEYDTSKCHYTGAYQIWQDRTVRVADSNTTDIDHDFCYFDYPTFIKANGYNGYTKPKEAPTLDTGSCYKLGETTVGALAVKSLLKIAYAKKLHTVKQTNTKTYDQAACDAVSILQSAWGYKKTGRAGENFVNMLTDKLK